MRKVIHVIGLSVGALGAMLLTVSAANAQSSPMPESKRQWPSQSGPQVPIQTRVCSCRYAGENIPIGQTICMKFEGRQVEATCDTVMNNPSWSISNRSCPST